MLISLCLLKIVTGRWKIFSRFYSDVGIRLRTFDSCQVTLRVIVKIRFIVVKLCTSKVNQFYNFSIQFKNNFILAGSYLKELLYLCEIRW